MKLASYETSSFAQPAIRNTVDVFKVVDHDAGYKWFWNLHKTLMRTLGQREQLVLHTRN